jgi:carbon storage regulator CsrA
MNLFIPAVLANCPVPNSTMEGGITMLCLTLSEGDYVMIGDSIKVHFNCTKGKEVVFGVEAPRELLVVRSELYEDGLIKMAEDGDVGAQALTTRLQEEHAERRQKYSRKPRVRHTKQERSMAV